jgi:hypothetical protein
MALTDVEDRAIRSEYEAGTASAPDLAEKWNVSERTIYTAIRRAGGTVRDRRGANHPRWNGGRRIGSHGYVLVLVGPKTYELEHRLVMANHLERPLTSNESVHHLNGDKTDNRIENLELRQRYHGNGHAATCNACGSQDITYK